MDAKKEQHWEKYRQPTTQKSKLCCYLYGLCDLVCFVGGAYLLSLAIFFDRAFVTLREELLSLANGRETILLIVPI